MKVELEADDTADVTEVGDGFTTAGFELDAVDLAHVAEEGVKEGVGLQLVLIEPDADDDTGIVDSEAEEGCGIEVKRDEDDAKDEATTA